MRAFQVRTSSSSPLGRLLTETLRHELAAKQVRHARAKRKFTLKLKKPKQSKERQYVRAARAKRYNESSRRSLAGATAVGIAVDGSTIGKRSKLGGAVMNLATEVTSWMPVLASLEFRMFRF